MPLHGFSSLHSVLFAFLYWLPLVMYWYGLVSQIDLFLAKLHYHVFTTVSDDGTWENEVNEWSRLKSRAISNFIQIIYTLTIKKITLKCAIMKKSFMWQEPFFSTEAHKKIKKITSWMNNLKQTQFSLQEAEKHTSATLCILKKLRSQYLSSFVCLFVFFFFFWHFSHKHYEFPSRDSIIVMCCVGNRSVSTKQ